jgi:nucleotide sugar dehydrogenase
MKIGIVGLGVVGSAISYGFRKLEHSVKAHDINLDTQLHDLRDTEIAFICVPTPQSKSGRVNVGIVKEAVRDLLEGLNYQGIVAIKSTVEPGTTEALINENPGYRICFVPEFLRERCGISDFVEDHDLCIIGTYDSRIYDIVERAHGHYPKCFVQLSPTEAEIAKYFNNTYNAMRITFANAFYQICKKIGVDYMTVKQAITKRRYINDHYLDCNESLRGFGGTCLPKDTHAIATLAEHLDLDIDILQAIISDNDKYPSTIL